MREIIFRGKRAENGEWVYGNLYSDKYKTEIVKLSVWENFNNREVVCNFPIDKATVGQYTSLKDKNGNKIFEGDIIKVVSLHYETLGKKINGEIVYDRGCFWLVRIDARELKQSLSAAELENNIEVIGNIHDNSELIK